MLDSNYFQSLSQELHSLKNRVRSFIRDRHWQTDGEWKESVLRAVLRRHLPKSVQVGRGFVLSGDGPSKQIDILIYDSTKPILFQDGDLVFITRDAVIGIIEVKSSLTSATFRESLRSLCGNAELVQRSAARERVYGLFAFEDRTGDIQNTLTTLKDVVGASPYRIVHFICLGDSTFIHYWDSEPCDQRQPCNKWHAYDLPERAAGYFLHNIIQQVCPQSVDENRALWFPIEGKEQSKVAEINVL